MYRKEKGKKLERLVADFLHTYFLEHHKQYKKLFLMVDENEQLIPTRDTSSGTFNDSSGDIRLNLLQQFFPFSIECKFHKDLNYTINSFLGRDVQKLNKIWIKQVVPNAVKAKLTPLLVFKANNTQIFVYYDYNLTPIDTEKYIKLNNIRISLFQDFVDEYIKKGE